MKTNLFLFACLAAFSLNAQESSTVTITLTDATIRTSIMNESTVKAKKGTEYHWFKAYEVHTSESDYDGRLLHGGYVVSDLNNQLVEKGSFKKGVREGTWMKWYANGKVKEETTWVKGKKHGSFKKYDSEGRLVLKAQFRNGQLHGEMSSFEHGELLKTTYYKKDQEVEPKEKKKLGDAIKGKKKDKAEGTQQEQQPEGAGEGQEVKEKQDKQDEKASEQDTEKIPEAKEEKKSKKVKKDKG